MRLAGLNMMFFSFGEMHHDLCFVQNRSIQVDNDAWIGFSVTLRPDQPLRDIEERLNAWKVAFTRGRVLRVEGHSRDAMFFRDPDGHVIEVVEAHHG